MIDACDFHNELFKKIYAILDILYYSLTYKLNDAIAEKFVRKSYDKLKSIIGWTSYKKYIPLFFEVYDFETALTVSFKLCYIELRR